MDKDHATDLRAKAESLGMYVEASVNPPADESDLERFDAEIPHGRGGRGPGRPYGPDARPTL